jgi:hypothetical protein
MQDTPYTAIQTVRKLIGEIKGRELETGRLLASEELRSLKHIDRHQLETTLRQVYEKRSVEELVACLESFLATIRPEPLTQIEARKVGGNDERDLIISVKEEVLYFFTRGAVAQQLIRAPWAQSLHCFHAEQAYLRTAKDILLSHYRFLTMLSDRLDPTLFCFIHESLVVNISKISDVDLRGRVKQVGVTPANGSPREWLSVSRRHFKTLRLRLGRPP